MIFTTVMATVDTQSIPEKFFWITIGSNAFLNTANGVYQSCAFGSAASLPMKYINAVSLGMNISGVVVALNIIFTIGVTPSDGLSQDNHRLMAIIYFSCAVVFLISCLILELLLRNNVRKAQNN